jgi:hypothetical protein
LGEVVTNNMKAAACVDNTARDRARHATLTRTYRLKRRLCFSPTPVLIISSQLTQLGQSLLLYLLAILSQEAVFCGNPDRSSMVHTPISRRSLDLFAVRQVVFVRSRPSHEVSHRFAS